MGAAFALQEAVLILSSVARHFHLEAVPEHVPQPVGRLTIRSDNGVRLTLHRRVVHDAKGSQQVQACKSVWPDLP